jgi:hypothetical protein
MQAELGQASYQALLTKLWEALDPQGILVIRETYNDVQSSQQTDQFLSSMGKVHYYSSIAATPIQEKVEISQYSLAVEENLRQEKSEKLDVFRVIQKS